MKIYIQKFSKTIINLTFFQFFNYKMETGLIQFSQLSNVNERVNDYKPKKT